MLRRVFISPDLPRDFSTFSSSFHEGLQSYKFYSVVMIVIGILLILLNLAWLKSNGVYLVAILLIILGVMLRLFVSKTVTNRKACFKEGKAIEARVISHEKSGIFRSPIWKQPFTALTQRYTIKVEYQNKSKTVVQETLSHSEEDIWETNPIGAKVVGLVHDNSSFFAEDFGASFKYFNK